MAAMDWTLATWAVVSSFALASRILTARSRNFSGNEEEAAASVA